MCNLTYHMYHLHMTPKQKFQCTQLEEEEV